ncbi:biotin/lipoyl attachment [Trichococcus palustris]|jgi:glutaconyl-CoA/methylmalonyl-CoA decarboxylase subunit gamma|uniref:Biotin/lipoyl attachment n=1 Tax=Trichococcus palustris TaxID=140314 RepID=A0A143YN96_9LACT|nr:biotin/lipoyl-containing protein [Trichococcus palustris]CZQ93775.1 biotin/lipoyl attachment [Trichococcus palustris]SFK83106.1 Biotin-requiring enzyme [Trichococcus palustris]
MKNYEIEIDGQIYRVKVRELPDDAEMGTSEKQPHVFQPSQPIASGKEMAAPMAGTILRVLVKEGQSVKRGENLIVLEAMKMENEIVAPVDGVIQKILVKPNEKVESDQLLLIL